MVATYWYLMIRTAALLAVLASAVLAQSPREFDTASIKVYDPKVPPFEACNYHGDPLMMRMVGCSLKRLIILAYDVKDYQFLSKGPVWMDVDRYMIEARTTERATKPEQMRMMQPLLADRFHVQVRWETRSTAVYLLKLAGHGLKLQPAEKVDHCGEVMVRHGSVQADCVTMDDIAELVEETLGERPVVNQTGVSKDSRYQIKLEYADAEAGDPALAASLVAALPDQLGLALKVGKAPLRMLIVDRAERPQPN